MEKMSETFEAYDMVTLSFSNDIHVSFGDLIVDCYLYAGKRLDEIKWQIEKGLKELLEGDVSEGHIGGIRHVITDKDIIMDMADLGAVGTFPNWEVPEIAYVYHLRIKLNEVSHIEEVLRMLIDWADDVTDKDIFRIEWKLVGKDSDYLDRDNWEKWTEGAAVERIPDITW
jgi:hypothetical protein